MNFDKNHLPEFIVTDLFKNSLIIIEDFKTEEIKTENLNNKQVSVVNTISYLGNNKKNILLLLKDETAVHIAEENLNFLTNLLTACKLNMGDVAIINLSNNPCTFTTLKEQLNPEFAILFNIATTDIELPFSIPNYQVQKFDGCSFLSSSSFSVLTNNNDDAKLHKSKLWISLKSMFNI